MHRITMWLPRPDNTRDVSCEMSVAQYRPCTQYATFDQEGNLLRGVAVYEPNRSLPLTYCSWKCVARASRRKQG